MAKNRSIKQFNRSHGTKSGLLYNFVNCHFIYEGSLWQTTHREEQTTNNRAFKNTCFKFNLINKFMSYFYLAIATEASILLTWQSRAPSTHTINIRPAILSSSSPDRKSVWTDLWKIWGSALWTGPVSGSTEQKGPTLLPLWNLPLSLSLCSRSPAVSACLSLPLLLS